jgi:hypothetical protein
MVVDGVPSVDGDAQIEERATSGITASTLDTAGAS